MGIQLDRNWPGASDDDENADLYTERPEVRRIAGELQELLKRLTVSSTAATSGGYTPGAPGVGGSLPDLQRNGALNQEQMGQWPAAVQYGMATSSAYSVLVGEPGSTSGLYAALTGQAEAVLDTLLDIARTSHKAEQASEEASQRWAGA
ncbi:hypothetical protein [Nonomuraea sp. NPDC049695]|uniref:hypothetical protein n=1 Tax=Nonomuraea sp. NPDC049695 TaxID=3154734 RepID=UPI0034144880